MRRKEILLIAAMSLCVLAQIPAAPSSEAPAAETYQVKSLAGLDPFSEEFDVAAENNVLATLKTPDWFKNTPTYEYLLEFNVTPFPNSFGQRYIEKKFNAKLKFLPIEGGNRQEQLNLQVATGNVPDAAKITLAELSNFTKQGIAAELPEEMVKEHMPGYFSILQQYDKNLLKYTRINGKNMGLALLHPYGGIPKAGAIRSDWLKNTGFNKVPATLDELEAAFEKFRTGDPDRNGRKDTYAMSMPSDWPGVTWFQSIFGAYGTNPFVWVERNGRLQLGFTTQETKAALKRLAGMYRKEIIDPEFITDRGRTSETEDIATKFAKGKLGYLDHLNYDDHQYDNDGHIHFRWVANHPEWSKWWEANKGDQNKIYGTAVPTDFNDSLPQPIFISMPPVRGPNGARGYLRSGYFEMVMMFGKQLEKEPNKLAKLLRILENQNQDEETYLMLGAGPEGQNWITGPNGVRLLNPDWSKHKHFHPQFKILGTVWTTMPMYWTNPAYLSIVGGPRSDQRHKLTADVIRKYPAYENIMKVALPSQSQYSELLDTRIKEYVIKAIAGDFDIDQTFDATIARWLADGGEQLTREANDWYRTIQ